LHDAEATIAGNVAASTSGPVRPGDAWGPGDKIGRYVVLERLGAGTMGVVVAAYDPALDRRVAIKLIEEPGLPAEADVRRRLREAQTLAKLSHPNVVAVHDVGEITRDGASTLCVFIAMEFVAGSTLRRWLQTPRTMEEIVAVFVQAGRGLAAAHAAGIIHRDFKPDNVMIGDEGRVRVMDFGLARAQTNPSHASDPRTSRHRFATVPGTPAYMAPEQHLEQTVGPAADQFAFCVALHEALVGSRPFAGVSPAEIAYSVTRETPAAPPRSLPEHVRVVLIRGLAREPAKRFESMDALLHVLAGDTRRARVRWVVGGLTILGLLAFAAVPDRDRTCERLGATIDEVWSPAQRSAVVERISGQLTRDIATRAAADLDRFASAWRVQRTAACTDGQSETNDVELAERRVACLEGARQEFTAIVEALEHDESGHLRPFEVLDLLPKLGRCADGRWLRLSAPLPSDPDLRAAVTQVRGILAGEFALEVSGRYDEADRQLTRAEVEAQGLDHEALSAELTFARGRLLVAQGQWEEAVDTLADSVWTALRARHTAIAIRAAMRLVVVESDHLRDAEAAQLWLQLAESLLVAAEVPDDPMWGELWQARGILHFRSNRPDEAIAACERALETSRRVPDPRNTAAALQTIALTHRGQERYERSNEVIAEAIDILRTTYGDGHPMIGILRELRGANLVDLRDYEGAIVELGAAIDQNEIVLPSTHFKLLEARWILCLAHEYSAHHDAAEDCFDDLLVLVREDPPLAARWRTQVAERLVTTLIRKGELGRAREWATGRDLAGPQPAWAEIALAEIDLVEGRIEAARERLERLIATLGTDDPDRAEDVFWARHALARVALRDRDVERAAAVLADIQHLHAVGFIWAGHADFVRALAGRVDVARGDLDAGIERLETSTHELLTHGSSASWTETAEAVADLARALAARGGDDARAIAMGRKALAIYDRLPGYAQDREAWAAELARLEQSDLRPHD